MENRFDETAGAQLPQPGPAEPSSLYRPRVWRWGHWTAQNLPNPFLKALAWTLGTAYWALNAQRRATVADNLTPVLAGDRAAAQALSPEVFRQFARKIGDLWRYESGVPVERLIWDLKGWDHLAAARQRGSGILLLTLHLGNWELGAALLAARGIDLTIITLDEPDPGLTEMRRTSRQRRGIETLVIGKNPFAFVEVIKRLENGAAVALLVDRPPAASATRVQLFGRPFLASMAAAELARATGCALLPVILPRTSRGYAAEVLPAIAYDRLAIGSRPAREKLTQEIVRIFEPLIRQHAAQWYHFVPIWPQS